MTGQPHAYYARSLDFVDHVDRLLVFAEESPMQYLEPTREWLDRIPARVFGCFIPGELRIILLPGNGFVDGGALRDVAVEVIPFELRKPNTPLWIQFGDDFATILRVWRREEPTP